MPLENLRSPRSRCGRLPGRNRCRSSAAWQPSLISAVLLLAALPFGSPASGAVDLDPAPIIIGEDRGVRITGGNHARDGEGGDDWGHDWFEFEQNLELGEQIDFQRVDGLTLGLTQRLEADGPYGPQLTLYEARAFNRGRWLYATEFEQPIIPDQLRIGAGFFRHTVPFDGLDSEIINDEENFLAAMLIKEDYRDYFEDEGVEAFIQQQLGREATLRATVIRSQHRPLQNSTRTSMTRWDEDFRPNPAADAGDLRAFKIELEYDSRPDHRAPTAAHWYRCRWEQADGGLGGDFDYERLLVDAREYLRTSPGQQLSWRLIYGTTRRGTLPAQQRFAIGGIGTLRAHAFKEFSGDEVLLANLEYSFDLDRDFVAMVFIDTGATAESAAGQSLRNQQFALDGGIGLGFQGERAAVYLARDLREPDAEFKLNFRLAATF